jgi:hypothetical protein
MHVHTEKQNVVAKLPERSSLAQCRETVFRWGKRSYMEKILYWEGISRG